MPTSSWTTSADPGSAGAGITPAGTPPSIRWRHTSRSASTVWRRGADCVPPAISSRHVESPQRPPTRRGADENGTFCWYALEGCDRDPPHRPRHHAPVRWGVGGAGTSPAAAVRPVALPVIGTAIETGSGIAFVHSHPDTAHPPSLSPLDHRTSIDWSRSVTPTLDRPFLSLAWTPSGLCGLVFEPAAPSVPRKVDRVEVLGESASRWVHPMLGSAVDEALDDRQARALGTLGNARLRQLHVALVGVGGTGSPLAEQLTRMGVRALTLIDPDVVDTESNLRRLVGSSETTCVTGAPRLTWLPVMCRPWTSVWLSTPFHSTFAPSRPRETCSMPTSPS